jgi:hypothetical protein
MAILSVDLAYKSWADLGIVVLDRKSVAGRGNARELKGRQVKLTGGRSPWGMLAYGVDSSEEPVMETNASSTDGSLIHCEILQSLQPGNEREPVDANILAGILNHEAGVRGIGVMMLDGPQAWKSRENGCQYARVSEHELNTAAKTGLPGMVKPVTYRPFAEFCLDVYDALCHRGWRRLETREQPGRGQERVLVESYPHAAWKALGLKPLPSKKRATVNDMAEAYEALGQVVPFTTDRPPNHDQLQAIVGGLPGLALEAHDAAGAQIVGTAPRREDGHWREGFIVLPTARVGAKPAWLESMRWLE